MGPAQRIELCSGSVGTRTHTTGKIKFAHLHWKHFVSLLSFETFPFSNRWPFLFLTADPLFFMREWVTDRLCWLESKREQENRDERQWKDDKLRQRKRQTGWLTCKYFPAEVAVPCDSDPVIWARARTEEDGTQQSGTVYPVGQCEGTAAMTHRNTGMENETPFIPIIAAEKCCTLFMGKYI